MTHFKLVVAILIALAVAPAAQAQYVEVPVSPKDGISGYWAGNPACQAVFPLFADYAWDASDANGVAAMNYAMVEDEWRRFQSPTARVRQECSTVPVFAIAKVDAQEEHPATAAEGATQREDRAAVIAASEGRLQKENKHLKTALAESQNREATATETAATEKDRADNVLADNDKLRADNDGLLANIENLETSKTQWFWVAIIALLFSAILAVLLSIFMCFWRRDGTYYRNELQRLQDEDNKRADKLLEKTLALAEVKSTNARLQEEQGSFRQDRDDLQAECITLRRERDECWAARKTAEEDFERSERALTTAVDRILALERELQGLQDRALPQGGLLNAGQLLAENDELREKLGNCERSRLEELENHNTEILELKAELEEQQAEIAKHKADLKERAESCETLIEAAKLAIAEAQKERKKMKRGREIARKDRDRKWGRAIALRRMLTIMEAKLVDLTRELAIATEAKPVEAATEPNALPETPPTSQLEKMLQGLVKPVLVQLKNLETLNGESGDCHIPLPYLEGARVYIPGHGWVGQGKFEPVVIQNEALLKLYGLRRKAENVVPMRMVGGNQ